MLRRRFIALMLALGIIAPAIVGCLTPAAEAQTMPCCAELNCPAGHQQACYSRTSPSGSTQATPELTVSLVTPALPTHAAAWAAHPQYDEQGKAYGDYALLHSPPDLYTVHSSLLI